MVKYARIHEYPYMRVYTDSIIHISVYGGARGVMVIVAGIGHGDTSSNPISHSTNTLGKGMNPIILPPAMGK